MLIPVEIGLNYMTLQRTNSIEKHIDERLSVQVSLTGLSFLMTKRSTSDVAFFFEHHFEARLAPEEILDQIEMLFLDHAELQQDFNEVTVIYATDLYSVVPSSLFDETKASEYLKFNSKILSNDFIATDQIDTYGLTVVYVPFININNFFFDRFGSFQYFHSTSILLRSLLNNEKNAIGTKTYIHVLKDTFDIAVIKKNALQLCNTHRFKTPEDFIYYILFTFEQLDLNPETAELVLCGNIDIEEETYKILYHYIRHISFFKSNSTIDDQLDGELPHNNYLLKQMML
jgi:hypothetical protein